MPAYHGFARKSLTADISFCYFIFFNPNKSVYCQPFVKEGARKNHRTSFSKLIIDKVGALVGWTENAEYIARIH